jgi:hypothetical protein
MLHKTKQYIHSAIRKYGKENFSFEILYQTRYIDDAKNKESLFIEHHNSLDSNFGYNLTTGGEGGDTSKFMSDEAKSNSVKRLNDWAKFQKGKTYKQLYGEEKEMQLINILKSSAGKKLNLSDQEIKRRSDHMKENNPVKNGHKQETKDKISATLKENNTNVGDKNGMNTCPESRIIIGNKNSKIHHLKHTETDEEILVKNITKWAKSIGKNPSSVLVYLSSGKSVNGWTRLCSYSQSSLPTSLSEMEILV